MVNDLVDSPLRVRYVFEGGPWVVFEDPWLLLLLLEYFLFLPSGGFFLFLFLFCKFFVCLIFCSLLFFFLDARTYPLLVLIFLYFSFLV